MDLPLHIPKVKHDDPDRHCAVGPLRDDLRRGVGDLLSGPEEEIAVQYEHLKLAAPLLELPRLVRGAERRRGAFRCRKVLSHGLRVRLLNYEKDAGQRETRRDPLYQACVTKKDPTFSSTFRVSREWP